MGHDARIQQLGVSVYTPDEARAAASLENLHLVQIPWSILDQKHMAVAARYLQDKGIRIAARSVYLQGLLAGRQPPAEAAELSQVLLRIQERAQDYGLSAAAYALRAALDAPYLRLDLGWL